jgi:hypothetical protein
MRKDSEVGDDTNEVVEAVVSRDEYVYQYEDGD